MNGEGAYGDGSYLANNPTWHEEDSGWKARKIAELLRNNGMKPASICEFGCGAGEVFRCLAQEYGDSVICTGFEVSPQAFAICKPKESPNLVFRLGGIAEAEDQFADVAMAIDVIVHIEDYFAFLREFRNRAQYKVLHIPLDLSVQSVLRMSPLLGARQSVGHIHYFTQEIAVAALLDAGFEVIDCRYTNIGFDSPSADWGTWFAKYARRIGFSVNEKWAARVFGGFSVLVLAR